MKRLKFNRIIVILSALLISGCSAKESTEEVKQTGDPVIQIPVTFLVNPDTGLNENEDLVKEFNEAYAGKYEIEVEWIIDNAEGYRSRIKTLNGLDRLPAVITDVGFDADYYELLVSHGRLVDLSPYMEESPEWTEAVGEETIEACREEDGSLCLAPIGTANWNYAGFYYNKELFRAAGMKEFPTTWDGFFQCLETLQKKGITPLALHGGNSYWTPLLIATNYMAGSEEGMKFLEIQYPESYSNASFRDMLEMMKRMYDYADEDAVEIERTEAAKRFQDGQNAIMANGGWMISTLPDEVKDHTGFAPFPGNILMEDSKMSAWAVTSGYSKEITEGAVEFLKFRAVLDQKNGENFIEQPSENVMDLEYKNALMQKNILTPNYQLKWEDNIQNDFFVNHMPEFLSGDVEADAFIRDLDAEVEVINAEK